MLHIEGPKQSWREFVESLPAGRAPQINEIFRRWDEYEEHPKTGRHSKENGECRAYTAYIAGAMEPDEQKYFGQMQIRVDQMVLCAIVPILRSIVEEVDFGKSVTASADSLGALEHDVNALRDVVSDLQLKVDGLLEGANR